LKEFRNIVEEYDKLDFQERKAAIATVMRVTGSAYRRPGARMLIIDNGKWIGAISGGCLEGDALRRSRKVIIEGKPELVIYDTMSDESATSLAIGLGCNGIIEILIEPINADDPKNPIEFLRTFLKNGELTIQATIFSSNNSNAANIADKALFCNNEYNSNNNLSNTVLAILKKEMQSVWQHGNPKIKKYFDKTIEFEALIEVLNPGIQLFIFGGGHDANPIVQTASQLGWEVVVTDDCIAHLGANRFPLASEVTMAPRDQINNQFKFKRNSAAVLISHNFKYDLAVYKELAKTKIKYIGIMGPKKRFKKIIQTLLEEGFEPEQNIIDITYAPIGLNIGAETPDEISLSIISEIQATFKNKKGGSLRKLKQPIHDREEYMLD
jgi:xanthine/CO dehydrogenase XdhC/CoxF family maturation factor